MSLESYGQILEETRIENLVKIGKMCKMDPYKGALQFCTETKKFLSTVNFLILVYKIILVSFDLYYLHKYSKNGDWPCRSVFPRTLAP